MMKYIIIILFSVLILSCQNESVSVDDKDKIIDARSKIIDAKDINNKIREGKNLKYEHATIIGDIDFTLSKDLVIETPTARRHYINSSITFLNCTFKGKLIAFKKKEKYKVISTFNKNITFIECTFQDEIKFRDADIYGLVNFSNSDFQKKVIFTGTRFNFLQNFFLQNRFLDEAKFNLTVFIGKVSFLKSEFEKNTIFQLAKFNDNAQFGVSKFKQNVDFTNIRAKGNILFNYAEFNKKVFFNNSVFSERTEFMTCKFNFISEFKNVLFYGNTKFNESTFVGVVSFENSKFILSEPETEKINILKGTDIILKNTLYLKNFEVSEFMKKTNLDSLRKK